MATTGGSGRRSNGLVRGAGPRRALPSPGRADWARFAMGVALALGAASAFGDGPAAPPDQPAGGPGGREYAHAETTRVAGGGGDRAWIAVLPAGPAPERAPVVVFVHGWAALSDDGYAAWIEHLARRGNAVICPRYQATLLTLPGRMTDAARDAVVEALGRLEREGPVRPDRARAGVIGHSMGGVIAANLAARGGRDGLPRFAAAMCVQPGGVDSMLEDPGRIPPGTRLLTVAGDRDDMVGDRTAKRIFTKAIRVAPEHRRLVLVRSDQHGSPPLIADHFSPMAARPREGARRTGLPRVAAVFSWALTGEARRRVLDEIAPDALDWFGYWRLADELLAQAFSGEEKTAAAAAAARRDMGAWSDGVPVRRLVVRDER